MTLVAAGIFCLLRPYNSVVYAPRAKHADSKHAPPQLSKGVFDWIPPIAKTKEQDFVDKVGLDAAVFMRVNRMLRSIFIILSVVGCGVLIPTYLVSPVVPVSKRQEDSSTGENYNYGASSGFFLRITPQAMVYSQGLWAVVACAYAFDGVVCYFLWRNYRAITNLRRAYFDSSEYQRSLHSRTLLLTDLPKEYRSDDGILKITEEVQATDSVPRAAIARNVKDLPDLVEEHEEAVRKLEGILAKYLKNPDKLPPNRPTCKPSKKDKAYTQGQKVDAIEYMTGRIKELELQIKEVRESVDKRNALPFGFASYEKISEAHSVAYIARKKGPQGTEIRLAPRPHDLVWKNLKLLRKDRNWNNFINNLWIGLLTFLWVGPNIFIAVFLADLTNLAALWPSFSQSMEDHGKWWGIVQGVAAPAVTTLFYYFLPRIFRQLCINAGDVSKTSRERHVTHKLYTFFVVNNLILFSLFATIFGFIIKIIRASETTGDDAWETLKGQKYATQILDTLIAISPYWISWLLQRNLGAAIDLSQLVNLAWRSFSKRFLAPTPREMIELSAPQPFDYAAYYNYFLFYATVALSFGFLQPLVLPVAAFYFWLDSYLKKYLLLYVFITKYESGGMFWRSIYNRMIFAMVLCNLVVALIVGVKGTTGINWGMLGSLGPLPFLLAGFKWYCAKTFDDSIHWYTKGAAKTDGELGEGERKSRKSTKTVGTRFGHPVLYQPLMTPMVSKKAQHLLKQIYGGRTSLDNDRYAAGYSDVYMDQMDASKPGKPSDSLPGFEVVDENNMDFEHYKNRPEFREQAGGDGELYGHPADIMRPGTPGSMMTGITRSDTWQTNASRSRSESRQRHFRDDSNDSDITHVNDDAAGMTEYPHGYHKTPQLGRDASPSGSERSADRAGLVNSAARMARSPSPGPPRLPMPPAPTPGGYGPIHTPGSVNTPGSQEDEETSYDYFRRGRGM